MLAATYNEREHLPETEIDGSGNHTQSLSERPAIEGTNVRAPNIAWVSDEQSRLGHEEFGARYELKDMLGHGGMGEIRLTHDRRIGRDVAAKFLHVAHATRAGLRERFVREACLQGQLEHPSIVPVHDLGVAPDGRLFFTMKRVRGMTLQEVIEKLKKNDAEVYAKFSRRKLLTAFSNICLTVAFAHEQGVIHRDLKPSNVMLGDFGETYVLDWGLAKISGEHESDERALAGTPGYMAPEQIGGDPATLSVRADVYALGAILFELLTLEPLHRRGDRDSVIRSTLAGADARASTRARGEEIPPELDAICIKATAFVPEGRFQSVRELNEALERFLDGDRDLELRSALAKKHVESAEESLRRSTSDLDSEEQHRSDAIREIGRAIALDPSNARAMKGLVRLLIEPPRTMPQEAQESADRVEDRTSRFAQRIAAVAYSATFLSVPALMWMGIRDWTAAAMLYGSIALLVLGNVLISTMQKRPNWTFYVRFFLSVLAIAASSRIFGPLVLAPACLAGNTLSFMLNPDRKIRAFVLFISPIGLLGPMALEWTGVLSPSYAFVDGMMCILPNLTALPPVPTIFFLVFVATGVPFMGGSYISRMRARFRRTEKRAHLYNWHLQQLVPREVRTRPRVRANVPSRPARS